MIHGPLYASYGCYSNGIRTTGHAIVVIGIDSINDCVYTQNPAGVLGYQSFGEFIQHMDDMPVDGWKLDNVYYLY